jgi:hypothetical protein
MIADDAGSPGDGYRETEIAMIQIVGLCALDGVTGRRPGGIVA